MQYHMVLYLFVFGAHLYHNSVRPSACLSVRRTSDPRLNDLRYPDIFTLHNALMFEDCCGTEYDVTVPQSEPSSEKFWYQV